MYYLQTHRHNTPWLPLLLVGLMAACNTDDDEGNKPKPLPIPDMAVDMPGMDLGESDMAPDQDVPDMAPDMAPDQGDDMMMMPTCSAATPVCDPGCSGAQECTFHNGICACKAVCLPDAPVCPGNGPNNGCAADERCLADCQTCEKLPVVIHGTLKRPSRSSTVDIDIDDKIVAMVNSDDGSVSFFDTATNMRTAKIASSATAHSEPVAVVISPDKTTAYVANRAAGTVARITGIQTASPALAGEVSTGGETMGVALSPTGQTLWATDWTAGTVTVINTNTMQINRTITLGGNPFAIAITNDGDTDDSDEKVLVTQFYGRPVAGKEAKDDGRVGIVHVIPIGASAPSKEIQLAPKTNCFSGMLNGNAVSVTCAPNQLYGITIHTAFNKTRAYVSNVAASPEGPVHFSFNVQALVSVIDVDAEVEEPGRTVNLNDLVRQQEDNDGNDNTGRRFLNTLNAIDFVPANDRIIGYATAAGSDIMLRVVWDEQGGVTVGAPSNLNIPVGQNPQGLVVKHNMVGSGAYVANLISRDLSFVLFRDQAVTATVSSYPVPAMGTPERRVWQGKRFFNTSTGIWSKEGWGSCQGCHPFGLTDNITWSFAAGPRQTTSMDGQYASNNPNDMRALNWTAIFDETDDFELNTRGVSGGKGTLQDNTGTPLAGNVMGTPFAGLLVEDTTTRENHQALNGSLRFIARNASICSNANTCPDFELIDEYVKTIRSPKAPKTNAALIAQGRLLFEDGGCTKCHSGDKWTISRTFYDPKQFTGMLPMRTFAANAAANAPMAGPLVGLPASVNTDTTLIAGDDSNGGMPAFKRIACNIRNVGTFGAMGGAEEIRANNGPAQGAKGFNVPSLLGLVTGAPYLHHGAAKDLIDLFDARFNTHTTVGNPNFAPNASEKAALVAFLLSIDESTQPFPIPAGATLCPNMFP
jgi:YVTN family beta-propeller protein